MTEHYVTLFDSSYLPHALALHASMERHAGAYRLWAVAMDTDAERLLDQLGLANVTVLPLREVETDRLRAVKPSRSAGEYCWTLTPFTPSFVFAADPSAQRATYVDADMWLTGSPGALFAEFEESGKGVMITDHAYAPEHDQEIASGRYCVQFMPFVRDAGDDVMHWWQDRCIEWCYARFEDGKFGDQKYLDDWPTRFASDVHVLRNLPALQAPWNSTRFDPAAALVFHFHELRTMTSERVRTSGPYRVPPATLELIYEPYLRDLAAAMRDLRSAGFQPKAQRPSRGVVKEAKDWLALRVLDRTPPRSPLTMKLPSP